MKCMSRIKRIPVYFLYLLFGTPTLLFSLVLLKIIKYAYVSEFLSTISFIFGEIERYYYKPTLANCGRNVTFNYGTFISNRDSSIGNNVWLGTYNMLGFVNIKDHVITAQATHF